VSYDPRKEAGRPPSPGGRPASAANQRTNKGCGWGWSCV